MSIFGKLVASTTAAMIAFGLSSAHAQGNQVGSDHDRVVGTFGVGYLGFRAMGVGTTGGTVDNIPVIGARYWLSDSLGIDAGIGVGFGGGSSSVETGGTTTETEASTPGAFMLHGGVPLNLADSDHFSFQIVPELDLGFAGQTIEGAGPGGDDIQHSGFHLGLGARAGAEIQFGFIDLPQLSLQGGVGLSVVQDSQSTDDGTTQTSTSQWNFGTRTGDNPWNIFFTNIAAIYYFGQ